MGLTNTQLQKLSRQRPPKLTRFTDERGLLIEVPPQGALRWRFRYSRPSTGKQNMLSLGTWPEVSLADARERREEARRKVAAGIDPAEERQKEKAEKQTAAANTFEAIARDWWVVWSAGVKGGQTSTQAVANLRRLEVHVFPYLGKRPLTSIGAPALLDVLRRLHGKGQHDTVDKIRGMLGQIWRYAISSGKADSDPTTALRGALALRHDSQKKHFPAVTDPARLGEILLAIDAYDSPFPSTALALRLAPLVFVRPGNLIAAEWEDFDLDGEQWTIPAPKLKRSEVDLIVPLSRQALDILAHAHKLTGTGRYVFPSTRGKGRPLSDMTLTAALRRVGIGQEEHSVHGWRATARTMLVERLGYSADLVEHQLAHAVRDANGRAYNRTTFLPQRREMMQRWSDYLAELRDKARTANHASPTTMEAR